MLPQVHKLGYTSAIENWFSWRSICTSFQGRWPCCGLRPHRPHLLSAEPIPDAARGQNLSLAHLSEVSFWKSSRNIDPTDLIRSITGTITLSPGTVIVLESTANGMNSFFYKEWMRAKSGKSAFKPVFVGWQEIALYTLPLDENFDFDKCDDYEKALWDKGCCLEQINWYHEKRKEYSEHNLLKA